MRKITRKGLYLFYKLFSWRLNWEGQFSFIFHRIWTSAPLNLLQERLHGPKAQCRKIQKLVNFLSPLFFSVLHSFIYSYFTISIAVFITHHCVSVRWALALGGICLCRRYSCYRTSHDQELNFCLDLAIDAITFDTDILELLTLEIKFVTVHSKGTTKNPK